MVCKSLNPNSNMKVKRQSLKNNHSYNNLWMNTILKYVNCEISQSVQSLSCVRLFATPWTAACQASLSITNSQSLLKLMSVESMMPCNNHLILCRPLFLLPSVFPSIRVFSKESLLHIRWPKYWSLSFGISSAIDFVDLIAFSSVQSLSRVQLFLTSLDRSMTGPPVHHHLLELAQTHIHWVSDAIQPSHPLSSPSPAFNLSQYQGLFQWVSSSRQVAKLLEFQPQHQSFQWIFRVDFL